MAMITWSFAWTEQWTIPLDPAFVDAVTYPNACSEDLPKYIFECDEDGVPKYAIFDCNSGVFEAMPSMEM